MPIAILGFAFDNGEIVNDLADGFFQVKQHDRAVDVAEAPAHVG